MYKKSDHGRGVNWGIKYGTHSQVLRFGWGVIVLPGQFDDFMVLGHTSSLAVVIFAFVPIFDANPVNFGRIGRLSTG